MRAVKSTSLGFGLVNIPVKLYKATEDHSIGFHQHHAGCNGAIGQQRLCKECGEVVEYGDIVKGIDRDGEVVIVTPDELASVERDTADGIELLQVVPAEQIDPIISGSVYYLAPSDAKSLPGYTLLREALESSGRVGVVRYVMREAAHIAVLRVRGNMLILQNMVWHEDIRQPEFALLDKPVKLADNMVAAAGALIDSMAGDFDHAEHTDEYVTRVNDLIDAKASGEILTAPAEAEAEADVSDLLAALTASVAAHPAGKHISNTKQQVA